MTPVAVLISDVHYSLPNLKLADAAMRMAIAKANALGVPLIVAGDLHDTKANLRGECISAIIETFKLAKIKPIVLVGNHDLISEKDMSKHALDFLAPYASIQKYCGGWKYGHLVAYHNNSDELLTYLKTIPKGSTLIMHQGITGSNSGEYIQDKSAITKDDVAGMRVISGHYHARQTIELLDGGSWSYIGNPFTTNFGEANDPPKGFQILMDDGSLEFIPTNLRKHIVYELNLAEVTPLAFNHQIGDLIWLKVTGTKEQLSTFKKPFDCRLDLVPLDTVSQVNAPQNLTQSEILDQLIDSLTNTSDETKLRLKDTWKRLIE